MFTRNYTLFNADFPPQLDIRMHIKLAHAIACPKIMFCNESFLDCAAKKGRNSGNGKTYTSVESDISAIFYQKLVLKSVEKGVTIRKIKKRLTKSPCIRRN